MKVELEQDRRNFLRMSTVVGAGMLLPQGGSLAAWGRSQEKAQEEKDEEVPATEDLMREHGVLDRVLLIYEEVARRIAEKNMFDPKLVAKSAQVVRDFIENYHEKDEEEFLFPRFEKAGKLVDLVTVLREQHIAGRRVTDAIEGLATLSSLKSEPGRRRLLQNIHTFLRMYRPHAAREDTVLFPAFRSVVSPQEYDAIGEEMEKKEQQLFAGDGFEKAIDQVAKIEKALGIYDLAKFTPR
ncbi:MAG TPA: hemerythrin domain-containing protein [Candidatus Acidoferrales bacterium]|nr:hemerythrin domain-containing protein [Candidatus Acidoferrales bacterium]